MKKNKILAGLSALVMGATMMGSMAMTASATAVTGTSLDGSFYAYYPKNGVYGLYPAPMGMDDYNINSITYNASTNNYTLTLVEAVYDNGTSGYISAIYTDAACTNDIGVDNDNDYIPDEVTLTADETYYLEVVPTSGSLGGMQNPVRVVFVVS